MTFYNSNFMSEAQEDMSEAQEDMSPAWKIQSDRFWAYRKAKAKAKARMASKNVHFKQAWLGFAKEYRFNNPGAKARTIGLAWSNMNKGKDLEDKEWYRLVVVGKDSIAAADKLRKRRMEAPRLGSSK
jgi:hypothetical protein